MAAFMVRQRGQGLWRNAMAISTRQMSTGAKQIDLESDVSLQEARSWDEGVASKFSTTTVGELFKVIAPFSPSIVFFSSSLAFG